MKKYQIFVTFVLFLGWSLSLNAQLKVGVGAGFQTVSMFHGKTSFLSKLGGDSKILPYVGLSVSHPLSKKISLSIEGDFVSGEYFQNEGRKRSTNLQELHYTLVHTSVIFRYQIGRKFSIGTGVLVYYIGPTTNRIRLPSLTDPEFVRKTNFDSSISYGIPLSFGYQFKKLFLELQWSYGFKSREITVYNSIQTLSLGLFYQFEFK